jgi:hypothetical protein
MQFLTADLLSRACRIFLDWAYPGGVGTIPPRPSAFLDLDVCQPLESLFVPPIAKELMSDGRVRGYALRLGSAHYPHLKLQVVNCDHSGIWVFAVDTHDGLRLDRLHPDAAACERIQAKNRLLKDEIERAWEAAGLLTFNALLRRGLDGPSTSPSDTPCHATAILATPTETP